MHNLLTVLAIPALALFVHAGVTQDDFTGIGHIFVLDSDDWETATPKSKVGCLNNHGKFISGADEDDCGIFSRLEEHPYTLSTRVGNCTFHDQSQETNNDSYYGKMDHAWNCNATYESDIYDELYTIDGFPYVFLCFGDLACFYDAKRVPKKDEELSLWELHWGSQQLGITPGHIQLQLMWSKIGDLPKRGSGSSVRSSRVRPIPDMQAPL